MAGGRNLEDRSTRGWRGMLSAILAELRAGPNAPLSPPDEGIRESEALYRLLAESSGDIIWLLTLPDKITYVSPACQKILGWSPAEQLGRREGLRMLTDESATYAGKLLADAIARGDRRVRYEAEHNRIDGSTVWCEVHQALLYDENGDAVTCVGITRDISETRKLREQLTVAQKAEAVGILAGGIAHDFNNFLTVIIGSLELLSKEIDQSDQIAGLLTDAVDAAERSAALTAQLLGISRNQPMSIDVLNVGEILGRANSLFDRLLGERVRLSVASAPGRILARADENQLQQILVNLILNARDAIEHDGVVTIETTLVRIDGKSPRVDGGQTARYPKLALGSYVRIAVGDNGRGMDAETLRRATEPFFSTKARGRGTGLGLAMVANLLKRSGGGLSIRSEVGVGTTVEVYLPAADPAADASAAEAHRTIAVAGALRGSERIVIVEDDDAVRAIARQILVQAGYSVHVTSGPKEALAYIETSLGSGSRIDLILTDLVMPDMSGAELAERVRASNPEIRFVVMSGYSQDDASSHARTELPGPLVAKPFHAERLLKTIRATLDR